MKSKYIATGLLLAGSLSLAACVPEDVTQEVSDATQVSGNGSGSGSNSSSGSSHISSQLAELPLEALSAEEESGLLFIREEEKLARDVYIAMYELYGQDVFDNISGSEQKHMDAIKALLDRYSLTDPVGDAAQGVFQDTALQGLYDSLLSQGQASLIDALLVGAAIEEIDIIDIQQQLDTVVDNQDITLVYENLIRGSRNHLRAFVSVLESMGYSYTPQYLEQSVFDAIISSPVETG